MLLLITQKEVFNYINAILLQINSHLGFVYMQNNIYNLRWKE